MRTQDNSLTNHKADKMMQFLLECDNMEEQFLTNHKADRVSCVFAL